MLPDSTMCLIWRRVLAIFIVACVTTCAHARYHVLSDVHMTLVPFSPIGVALSIFLGFRNNASYDRFWEARKLWGQIVNARRTITRQILVLVGPVEGSEEEREHHRAPLPSLPAYRVDHRSFAVRPAREPLFALVRTETTARPPFFNSMPGGGPLSNCQRSACLQGRSPRFS